MLFISTGINSLLSHYVCLHTPIASKELHRVRSDCPFYDFGLVYYIQKYSVAYELFKDKFFVFSEDKHINHL